MKTKLYVFILWSVLSIGLLVFDLDAYEPPFTRRKTLVNVVAPKSKSTRLSTTGDPSLSKIPFSRSSSSKRRSKGPQPPPAPLTPRAVRPGDPRAEIQSVFAYVPDVSVTCSTSDFVLRVKPAFYGLGAEAEELTLGNTCKSNGVLRPYGDLLFTYPLTACDAVRQSPHDHLLYKFVLHFEPSPKRFPSRTHRMDVDIECRYPRSHHVYQLSVQPTWKTSVVRKRLKGSLHGFQIELMDESWSGPAKSQVFQLGNKLNFQVSALHLSPGEKLYINSCYARPSSGSKSSLKYTIIDFSGCMLDSRRDPGASHFTSRTDTTVRFSLKAFHFTSDPETEISVDCKVFVTSGDPGPSQKSCTYKENRWKALTGDDSICECCDSQCVTSKSRRAMTEGFVSSGSLLVSDQPYIAEDGFLPISPTSVSMSGDGEATVIHNTDEPDGADNLQRHADLSLHGDNGYEEEEWSDGDKSRVIIEPGLGFKEETDESDSNPFEDDGSGYSVDYSESEKDGEEGGENEISDVQQKLESMAPLENDQQREFQLLFSGEEEGKTKQSEKEGEKTEPEIRRRDDAQHEGEDLGDDGKMTWYFWR